MGFLGGFVFESEGFVFEFWGLRVVFWPIDLVVGMGRGGVEEVDAEEDWIVTGGFEEAELVWRGEECLGGSTLKSEGGVTVWGIVFSSDLLFEFAESEIVG